MYVSKYIYIYIHICVYIYIYICSSEHHGPLPALLSEGPSSARRRRVGQDILGL